MISIRTRWLMALGLAPVLSCSTLGLAQEAGVTPEQVNSVNAVALANASSDTNMLYAEQWIHAQNGSIKGSVVALVGSDSISLPKVRVSLVQAGSVVAYDDSDVEGEFLLEGVNPGVYTLLAQSPNGIAVFGLTVLSEAAGAHLPNAVEVRLMPTSSRVMELLRGQSVPKFSSLTSIESDPLAGQRQFAGSHLVSIDSQGKLTGKLGKAGEALDMSRMMVFITKDGQEVVRARVAADGSFEVLGLTPGCYGLVAAGDQGVAAIGFCATNRNVAKRNANGEIFVNQGAVASSLNVELGDSVVEVPGTDVPVDPALQPAPAPMAMGPGMGGYPMGGYGGGGGGGFGRPGIGLAGLAGIGGLTAAAIIAATDDNPPVSPVTP